MVGQLGNSVNTTSPVEDVNRGVSRIEFCIIKADRPGVYRIEGSKGQLSRQDTPSENDRNDRFGGAFIMPDKGQVALAVCIYITHL